MDTDISRILLSTLTDSDYDQSQLKLHITTELCYYTDDENTVNRVSWMQQANIGLPDIIVTWEA